MTRTCAPYSRGTRSCGILTVPRGALRRRKTSGPEDAAAIGDLVRASYAKYVERIGKEPAPMLEDYAALISAGEGRTVWASFDWVLRVDLETALEQQERLAGLVGARRLVVKTGALGEVIDEWSSAELGRAQSAHSGTILASESGLSLSRATPMPPS